MTRKKATLETLEVEEEQVSKPKKSIKITNSDVMLPRSKSRYVPQFR